MITAFTSTFVIFDKNEFLIFRTCFKDEITIFSLKNFGNFSIKIFQPFPGALNFISGNAAWFELIFDESVEF